MRTRLAVGSDAGPPVIENMNASCAEIYHRFDRDRHAGHESCSPSEMRNNIIRNLWSFMHIHADAVTDELTNDTVAM